MVTFLASMLFILASILTLWWVMVPAAFLAMLSFFQINSYQADKHKLNAVFLIIGIVLVLVVAYCAFQLLGSNSATNQLGK